MGTLVVDGGLTAGTIRTDAGNPVLLRLLGLSSRTAIGQRLWVRATAWKVEAEHHAGAIEDCARQLKAIADRATSESISMDEAATRARAIGTRADPIMLEVFNNLFMSIAEQMGVSLQNTAYSVNIKERVDFSCAVFANDGTLVANAPHMPVHLGSMDRSVETVLRENRGRLHGDPQQVLRARPADRPG